MRTFVSSLILMFIVGSLRAPVASAQVVVEEVGPVLGTYGLPGDLAPFDIIPGGKVTEQHTTGNGAYVRIKVKNVVPVAVLDHYRIVAEGLGWTTTKNDADDLEFKAQKGKKVLDGKLYVSGNTVTIDLDIGVCLVGSDC